MGERQVRTIDFMDADGTGLRLEFAWRRDRFQHKLAALIDGRAVLLLESVEGSDEAWPPSPPLQQLSIEETRLGARVALLVGMAGRSHWSLSVEPGDEPKSLIFDAACLVRGDVGQLGSAYQFQGRATAEPSGWLLEAATARLRLHGLPTLGTTPVVDCRSDRLVVQPTPTALSAASVRWRYVARIVDGAGGLSPSIRALATATA